MVQGRMPSAIADTWVGIGWKLKALQERFNDELDILRDSMLRYSQDQQEEQAKVATASEMMADILNDIDI